MTEAFLTAAAQTITTEIEGLTALQSGLSDPSHPLAKGVYAACETIMAAHGRVVVTGMGKSGHIGRKIAATLASTGCAASFVHPGEASHGDLGMISTDDVVLALSNSGETPELGDVIAYCGRFDIPLIGMTSKADSALGRASDILLPLPNVPEACAATRAPTTSTTMSLALGDAVAVALLTAKGFTSDDFKTFHPGGKLGASLKKVRELFDADRQLPLVHTGTQIGEAVSILTTAGFGCVGITQATGELIGIITDGDLRRHLAPEMMEKPVDQVMTERPKTVTPETLAAEALGILSRTRITALFVVEAGKPVGLIHVHDLLDTGVQ